MGASLETRINTVEHIQEEFGHDIQEIKGQLVRLTKLIKGHTRIMLKNIRGSHPFHCNHLFLLSYTNDIQVMNLGS